MLNFIAPWLGRHSLRSRAQVAASSDARARDTPKRLDIRESALGVLGAPAPRVQAFTLPRAAQGVIAQDAKLACDSTCDATFRWALGGLFAEGLGFLGYPYLAELTQRPEYPRLAAALHPIYTAPSAQAAEAQLLALVQGPWGSKLPTVMAMWRRAWDRVIPFFAFPTEVRKVVYTTNSLESVNAQLRKIIKTRGHFPSDDAATKHLWLALRNITADWHRAAHY